MALPFSNDFSFSSTWRRAALVSLAVLVLAGTIVALVGSGGSGSDDEASTAASGDDAMRATDSFLATPATTVAPSGASASETGGGVAYDQAAPTPLPIAATGPRIIRTASLRIRVKGDVAAALERANGIATGVGGFVAASTSSSLERGRSSGELTLRVPADRFDDVRRRLGDLGKLQSIETGSEDVGGQLVDLAARLRTLRAEEGALDAILGDTRDIGQILQVRDRLTGVRTQIEQLAGQQVALQDQVAYATIQVSLFEAGAPVTRPEPKDEASGLADSFGTAVDAAEAVVGGMIVVLGAVLPFALLGLVGFAIYRVGRRRLVTSA